MTNENLHVVWIDSGFEPTCKPDPKYPHGVDLDLSKGQVRSCQTELAYPAKRCGHFMISCSACGIAAAVTTAGRPDDPRSVKLACKSLVTPMDTPGSVAPRQDHN